MGKMKRLDEWLREKGVFSRGEIILFGFFLGFMCNIPFLGFIILVIVTLVVMRNE